MGPQVRFLFEFVSFASEFGILVPLVIIDFVDSLLAQVCAIDCLCVVVGNVGCLACFGDRVPLFMDEAYEFTSLFICDLHVLSDHLHKSSE